MKKYLLFILFSIVSALLVSFDKKETDYPIQKIEAQYRNDYVAFRKHSERFNAELKESEPDKNKLMNIYFDMRYAFKKIEFLWSLLDREFVTKYINGPPLPKLEPNAPNLNVLEPQGLQCIDEALFEQELDVKRLSELSNQLLQRLSLLPDNLGVRDQQFFDAAKLSIVRLAYVSSSGFDVPGSLSPFVDVKASLESLVFGFMQYKSLFKNDERLLVELENINKRINETLIFVQTTSDFEQFDRVRFIRNYLNPLFEQIVRFHKQSGFETYYEVTHQRLGVNLLADNLINDALLDKEFFFSFPKDVDSIALVTLGKTLFYDPILSAGANLSCASCHNPTMAFTDGVSKSITHNGNDTVERNALGLLNAVYAEKYFYDLRTDNLINQIEHVIVSKKEMNADPLQISQKLQYSDEYTKMFDAAFLSEGISYQRMAVALASYVASLTDFNTEVDAYLLQQQDTIAEDVYAGMNLFYGKAQCASCHFGPTYAGLVPPFYIESESELLGVPDRADKTNAKADNDVGRFANIKERAPFYKGSFKTTTARNTALTAPYMHNGVFKTLEEVIDFYNEGGGNGWGFELEHQTLSSDKLQLTEKEKMDLIAFLKALNAKTNQFSKPERLPTFTGELAKYNQRAF